VEKLDESKGPGIAESISIEDEAMTSRQDVESHDNYIPEKHGTAKVVKTGNFMANKARGSKFTNHSPANLNATHKSGASLDQGDSYYDADDFDSVSMSKSMGGMGFGLTGGKQ
jgi:hypothetical protein